MIEDVHECTEGGVEFVGGNGVGMGLHVRANSTVKDKVILGNRYLIPGITNNVDGVDDVEGFEGSGGVEAAKGAGRSRATGRIEGHTEIETSASSDLNAQ
jgi:hypothetical protein